MIPYFALETLRNKKPCSNIISRYFTLVHQWKPRLNGAAVRGQISKVKWGIPDKPRASAFLLRSL